MIGRLSLLFAAITGYSDFLAGGANIGHHSFDAYLIDRAQTFGTYIERNPALLGRQPKTTFVRIHLPPPLGLDVGMRNGMPRRRVLIEDITTIWHWTSIDAE